MSTMSTLYIAGLQDIYIDRRLKKNPCRILPAVAITLYAYTKLTKKTSHQPVVSFSFKSLMLPNFATRTLYLQSNNVLTIAGSLPKIAIRNGNVSG